MENEELADEVLNGAAATVDGFHLELRGRIMTAIQKARQEERENAAAIALTNYADHYMAGATAHDIARRILGTAK